MQMVLFVFDGCFHSLYVLCVYMYNIYSRNIFPCCIRCIPNMPSPAIPCVDGTNGMKLSTLSHVVHQQCPLLVYPRVPSVSLQTELLPTFNDSCGCQLFINVKECRDEDNHPAILT